jgi:hypothetical protein
MSVLPDPLVPDAIRADFARAVRADDATAARRLTSLCHTPAARTLAGLHIHASTTRHTLIRALAEAAPSFAAALAPPAFAALAVRFIAEHPPRRPELHAWGDELPAFLERQGSAPCLIGLARLDRAALAAFFAAEAQPITAAALGALAARDVLRVRLTTHPSLRLVHAGRRGLRAWLDRAAVPQVESRWEMEADGSLVVIVRPFAHLRAVAVSPATFAFLTALGNDATLLQACERALGESSGFDIHTVLAALFEDGMFSDCIAGESPNGHTDNE